MLALPKLCALLSLSLFTHARDIVVTVGGNTTENPGAVFDPQVIVAELGDVVIFNFTQGNHTATQALFASPCIPANRVDTTINGFDSGFRDAGNFTAITTLPVPVTDPNTTIWFYDHNTCAEGGVGGVNINETSLETIDGFARNAVRLNGSEATESVSRGGPRPTGIGNGPAQTESGASRAVTLTVLFVVAPLLAVGVAL
ncbi:hypothetical protein FA15DRAFT_670774 [Coprinopsis marcescibilis]|uniref:Cupredoxin n=1 Tax=Coprinopsis marcescibilis TaxID=230819 RepID=A0A5C3KRV0_COPMA|nr:hypothetical protein FA15DRAFT_670774 [Coprinopsis marcescibilis]